MNNIEKAIMDLQEYIGSGVYNGTNPPMYINTVTTAILALEKQVSKKPILYGDSEDGKLLCPSCEEDLWDVKECGYSGCPYCLQAIDWSVEE